MTLEQLEIRLKNLERAFIQSQTNNVPVVSKADMAPMVQEQANTNACNISANSEDILNTQLGLDETYEQTLNNADDIVTTQMGLDETYESMLENYDTITQCQEAITELYEMIINTEEE